MQLLTVRDVARRAGLSEAHVRQLIATGRLAAIDFGLAGRRCWRVPEDTLEALVLEAREVFRKTDHPTPDQSG